MPESPISNRFKRKMSSDWEAYRCRCGESLFHYNMDTTEHKWINNTYMCSRTLPPCCDSKAESSATGSALEKTKDYRYQEAEETCSTDHLLKKHLEETSTQNEEISAAKDEVSESVTENEKQPDKEKSENILPGKEVSISSVVKEMDTTNIVSSKTGRSPLHDGGQHFSCGENVLSEETQTMSQSLPTESGANCKRMNPLFIIESGINEKEIEMKISSEAGQSVSEEESTTNTKEFELQPSFDKGTVYENIAEEVEVETRPRPDQTQNIDTGTTSAARQVEDVLENTENRKQFSGEEELSGFGAEASCCKRFGDVVANYSSESNSDIGDTVVIVLQGTVDCNEPSAKKPRLVTVSSNGMTQDMSLRALDEDQTGSVFDPSITADNSVADIVSYEAQTRSEEQLENTKEQSTLAEDPGLHVTDDVIIDVSNVPRTNQDEIANVLVAPKTKPIHNPDVLPVRPLVNSELNFEYRRGSSMSKYEEITPDGKRYKCPDCGKLIKQSGTLTVHMRMHTGEKPFKCSRCGKLFRASGPLSQHMLTHITENPFKCSVCGMGFKSKYIKLKHRQQAHQE